MDGGEETLMICHATIHIQRMTIKRSKGLICRRFECCWRRRRDEEMGGRLRAENWKEITPQLSYEETSPLSNGTIPIWSFGHMKSMTWSVSTIYFFYLPLLLWEFKWHFCRGTQWKNGKNSYIIENTFLILNIGKYTMNKNRQTFLTAAQLIISLLETNICITSDKDKWLRLWINFHMPNLFCKTISPDCTTNYSNSLLVHQSNSTAFRHFPHLFSLAQADLKTVFFHSVLPTSTSSISIKP